MTLVPAIMSLLGRAAWWLPGWLDRILPHVDIEGANLPELPAAASLGAQATTAARGENAEELPVASG